MKLREIIQAECYDIDAPCDVTEEPRSAGLGRPCDYCPSEAKNQAYDRYVCDQHYKTAEADYEDAQSRKRRGRKVRIASQEVHEQPDITDDEDEDEELNAGLPDVDVEGDAEGEVQALIREEGGKFCVRSPTNSTWSGGCFDSKGEAKKRLTEIEYFKKKDGAFFHEGEFFMAYDDGVYWFDAREGAFIPWRRWSDAEKPYRTKTGLDKEGNFFAEFEVPDEVIAGLTGVQKDLGADHPKRAAGILFVCQGRVLLVKRAHDEKLPDIWSIPGGHVKLAHDGMPQDVWGNAKREVKEEMGGLPPGTGRATRKHRALSKTGKTYVTYVVELPPGAMKWRPRLNPEHASYRWCNRKQIKALKLHPNVARVLKNTDIWDGKFYTSVTIHLERSGEHLGAIMQEGKQQVTTINAAAEAVFGDMGKDLQYMRLELTTVVHGPPGYIPVAGVGGVLRKGSTELFFQSSISPRNGNLRVLLTTRKTGFKRAATFKSAKGIAQWITKRLSEHLDAPAP
jgi:8-oxo-dGTP pyrophosphatase MutT (NUDIX family)